MRHAEEVASPDWEWANDALEHLKERIRELDILSWDDGGADLNLGAITQRTAGRFNEALRQLMIEGLDLSEAAWRPTGRTVTLYRDGRVEVEG